MQESRKKSSQSIRREYTRCSAATLPQTRCRLGMKIILQFIKNHIVKSILHRILVIYYII